MPAKCPSSHSWRLQREPSESSSLMAIPHKCRLYRHVRPDGIPYASVMAHDMFTLQELWEKIVGNVLHGWYRPYINHKHNRIINQNSLGWRFYAYPYKMENGSKHIHNICSPTLRNCNDWRQRNREASQLQPTRIDASLPPARLMQWPYGHHEQHRLDQIINPSLWRCAPARFVVDDGYQLLVCVRLCQDWVQHFLDRHPQCSDVLWKCLPLSVVGTPPNVVCMISVNPLLLIKVPKCMPPLVLVHSWWMIVDTLMWRSRQHGRVAGR